MAQMDDIGEKCSGLKKFDWTDNLKGEPVLAFSSTSLLKKYDYSTLSVFLDLVQPSRQTRRD